MQVLFSSLLVLLILLPTCVQAGAWPDSLNTAPPISMGLPSKTLITWGPISGYDFDRREVTSRLYFDVTMKGPMGNFGVGDMTVEIAAGHSGNQFDGAMGLYVKIPWLRAGVDYSSLDAGYSVGLNAQIALARGGLFKRGDELRIDYRPQRQEVLLGFTFARPFQRYRMTRPRSDHARLPAGKMSPPPGHLQATLLPADLAESLSRIEQAILWMDRLLTPKFHTGDDFAKSAARYRLHIAVEGHTFRDEDERYHRELRSAFTLAADGEPALGDQLAATAESIIFHDVLVPFNNLFGQNKAPHRLAGFGERAETRFRDHLQTHSYFQHLNESERSSRQALTQEVFRRVLAGIDKVTLAARKRWGQPLLFWLRQSRMVWLPLNYGLRPEQYDTQPEWDAILAHLTGQDFGSANTVSYLINEQFHHELVDMIRETETYQVMIIHDFRGRYGDGETDMIGWDVIVNGYLSAFTHAVEELDSGERGFLPRFFIFFDENYFHTNKSKYVMSFLQNLYDGVPPDLENEAVATRVAQALAGLRNTIADSPNLADLPLETLRNLFKIHINITNPYDPVFASDSPYRDHRKLAFRDVFETDPSSGSAIFTGHGVGEHYNSPGWEDRAIQIRGESLIQVKTAARELFRSQGYDADEVPVCLQAIPYPSDYRQQCDQLHSRGWTTPVLLSFNETGYGIKQSTVVKAAMYNMLPPGGVMIAPDSLWISEFWSGMFVGAALRGAHLYAISPAPGHAPSNATITMYMMQKNMEMMMRASEYFAPHIADAEGSLRVGFYDNEHPVYDLRHRIETLLHGQQENQLLEKRFALHPETTDQLHQLLAQYESETAAPGPAHPVIAEVASDHDPFMHLKAQFLASERALEILSRPEWASVVEAYFEIRRAQIGAEETADIAPRILYGGADGHRDLITAYRESLAPSKESSEAPADVIFMLTVGSHNQDPRSMLVDGEDMVVVSGYDSLISMLDFMYLLSEAEWPATLEEMQDVFPEPSGSGFFKKLFWVIKDLV